MSTVPAHRGRSSGAGGGWAGLLVRMLLPVLASTAFGLTLLGDELSGAYELRSIAPDEAARGAPLPIRAVLFAHVDRLDGGEIADLPLEAHLDAPASGWRSAAVHLRRSEVLGAEGALTVPMDAPAEARVVVEARVPGGRVVRTFRPLQVRLDPARPPRIALPAVGREAADGPDAADDLALAVPSGACIPELPCRLVLSGPEGTSLAIEPTMEVAVAVPPRAERSIAEATIVVRGPDARVELVASRGGREVARRRVRLPLVPGGIAVDIAHPVVGPGQDPGMSFQLLDERPVAVDLFRDELWVAASSARGRLELPSLAPGLYRVQVSRHLFAPGEPEPVGIGLFFVTPADERSGALAQRDPFTSRDALGDLRRTVLALALPGSAIEWAASGGRDAPRDDLGAPDPESEATRARALLAPLAQAIVCTPEPAAVDGDSRAEAERVRRRHRLLGALVCLGAGLGAAFLLVRRGLAAEREAARLRTPEAPTPEPRDERVGPEVLAHGALVFLTFAAVALLLYVYGL